MPTLPMLDKNVNHSPHVVLLGAGASLASFKEGDANKRILPLMNNFVEVVGLNKLLEKNEINYNNQNFEEIYNDLSENEKYNALVRSIEEKTFEYFSQLKIPSTPTIYDYLVLSLREKDIIATFNWDPLLLQAYARNSGVKRLPRLEFLHGNVGMGVCVKDKVMGHIWNRCSKCKEFLKPVKLLYPIKKKDYSSDSVIKAQWDSLRSHLNYAYMFTIFGYSAPTTDIDAKELMLSVWKNNKTLELAEVEIIDTKSEKEIIKTWKDFTFSHHYQIHKSFFDSYLARFPRRSCDAFAESSLMCKFLEENKFPKFENIEEMHKWIKPLIEEEESMRRINPLFSLKHDN